MGESRKRRVMWMAEVKKTGPFFFFFNNHCLPLIRHSCAPSSLNPSIFFRCFQLSFSSPCQPLWLPIPQLCAPRAVEGGNIGVLPCCAPPQPQWPFSGPFCAPFFLLLLLIPLLQPPTYPSPPQVPCCAGDRPLNEGPGVPDGSYRWSVVIGPIEPCHRLFPTGIQRPGHITPQK